MNPQVTTRPDGNYEVSGTMTMHDPDKDLVTGMRIRITSPALDQTITLAASAAEGKVAVLLLLPKASFPKGTYDYSLALIDETKAEGPPKSAKFTVP